MNDDLLERSTAALRAESAAPDASLEIAAATRARILRDVAQPRRRGPLRRLVTIQLIAAVLVAGAWAGATGRLSSLLGVAASEKESSIEIAALPQTASRPALPSAERREPEAVSTLPVPPDPDTAPVKSPPAMGAIAPTSLPRRIAPAPTAAEASIVREVSPDADRLYQEASDAHFARKDYASALVAWERYLVAAPTGRFGLEARYNRAIALVRLGRTPEAAAALRPFAEGDYGAYRRDEARALLKTLTNAPP